MANIVLGRTELIIKIIAYIGWFLAGFFYKDCLNVIKEVFQ